MKGRVGQVLRIDSHWRWLIIALVMLCAGCNPPAGDATGQSGSPESAVPSALQTVEISVSVTAEPLDAVAAQGTITPTQPPVVEKGTPTVAPASLATTVTVSSVQPVTVIMTATVTPTATVFPSALQMLVAANIRSGPGMDFPVVGYFSADAHPVVIGVSPDRGWWRVACPAGVEVDACWVVNDATVSIALSPVPASTQISQTPAPTVPPDPTPCTPVPGAGWGTYVVQDGDTLSTLASNTGVTVAELQAANCVEGELIVAGSPLYVPVRAETMNVSQPVASVAGGVATSAPDGETGRSALTQRIHFVAPGGGIAAGLDSAGSGSGSCPASVDEEVASVLIPKRQDNTIVDWREWESGEAIYLCFYGFPEDEEIVLTILDGGRTVIEQKIPVTTSTNRSYRWLLTTDFPHQEAPYSIQATAPGATVSGELRVLPATGQHILVLNNTVQVGDPLHINVMDKKISTTVYLYRNYGSDQTKCGQKYCYVGTIGPFPVQPNRGADLWIDTSELEAGIYVVAAGIDEAINLRNAGLFRLQ